LDHAGSNVFSIVQFAPLQFGLVQGFQRVYNMLLLGHTTGGAPEIDIYTGYNGVAAALEVSASATLDASGGFQFEHQFFTQKCESLLLKLRFSNAGGAATGRIRLTDIAFSVGVKKGPWKSAEIK
jgi:hypothetical protein